MANRVRTLQKTTNNHANHDTIVKSCRICMEKEQVRY